MNVSWKLIDKIDGIPMTEVWYYSSRSRRCTVTITYYYDADGKLRYFGIIMVQCNKKKYYLNNKKELQRFLEKYNVPFPPIPPIEE
jgi:hypothetical protein